MHALSRPTIIGIGAIAIWATLALFTAMTGKMPPFLTTAICFALGGLVIVSPAVWRRDWLKLKPTLPAFLLGQGPSGPDDWLAGLRLTGHFLARDVFGTQHRPLPSAREMLVDRLAVLVAPPAELG
jgi:DNA repair protein RecO (recombination protein O)